MNKIERAIEYMLQIANNQNEEVVEDIIEILEENNELNNEWTPVGEKLPNIYCKDSELYNFQRVLGTLQNGCVCEMWWSGTGFRYAQNNKFVELTENPVVAWKSLPNSYKE